MRICILSRKLPEQAEMAAFNLNDITSALQNTRVSPDGVTFEGKSLKLDTEDDGNIAL